MSCEQLPGDETKSLKKEENAAEPKDEDNGIDRESVG